jgi:hypothetical protein
MKYNHNFKAFGREVLTAAFMKADMDARAKRALAEAESIAPHDTGEYAASFEAGSEIRKGQGARRAVGYLRNTSDHAEFVEYGSEHTPAYHVLARSLNAMGD